MLVELRDVEVFIEPQEILTKALQEGDLDVSQVITECIYEESVEAVLDAVDNNNIEEYCNRYEIGNTVSDFDTIVRGTRDLNPEQKAQLLWLLLKCEG